jgi:2-polyprenyl-6-methoxyphenol hydroxylase-like FAD-dependent oxidoreductase
MALDPSSPVSREFSGSPVVETGAAAHLSFGQPNIALAGATVDEQARETLKTNCCIVGGGPAGVMLSLLLARAGVPVILLEAHKDFDRDVRGDTIQPATLEVLDQIGLADRLHELPHTKMRELRFRFPTGVHTMAVFSRLPTRFPYVMTMPQPRFLEFIIDEAKKDPHFALVMNANVQQLVERDGVVLGVRYRGSEGWCEVDAPLTVATDGRFSRLRKLAALEPVSQSASMEVIWFGVTVQSAAPSADHPSGPWSS